MFKSNLGWVKESDKHISSGIILCLGYPGNTIGKQKYLAQKPVTNLSTAFWDVPSTVRDAFLLRLVMTHVYPLLVAQLQA